MSTPIYRYSWDQFLELIASGMPLFLYKMYDRKAKKWVNVGMMIKIVQHFYRIEMILGVKHLGEEDKVALEHTYPGSAERLTPISKKKFHMMNKLGILKPLMAGEEHDNQS